MIGYLQRGLKDKPLRGLSATVPPESAQPQHSWSWVYKGEWQRVMSQRMFLDIKGQLFGYDFPLATVVDLGGQASAHQQQHERQRRRVGRVRPGPPGSRRSSAQSTYFIPEKAGGHDLKFGFEYILDISKYIDHRRVGPDPLSRHQRPAGSDPVRGRRRSSRISAAPGRAATTAISGIPATSRIGGARTIAPRSRPDPLGLPAAHYLAGQRNPIIQDVYQGAPIFSNQTTPGKDIFTRNSFAPRIGVSYDLSGKGTTVLKAFYGRFYYNYAGHVQLAPIPAPRTTRPTSSTTSTGTRSTTVRRN